MTMNRPTLGMDRLPSLANDNDTAQRRLGLDDGFALERLKTNLEQATSHCRGLSLRGAPTLLRRLQQYTASSNQFRCQRTVRDSRQLDVLHEYEIIATTRLFNPRTVLVNCLKWLLDANVQQIWILVQMEHYDGLRNDEEYGSRLLHWNDMANHPVKLVFADNLWQGIALVNAAACNATIISWRNADEPWVETRAEMEIATDLFRQRNHADLDSSILYASHGWMYHALPMSNSQPWWCSGTKPTDDNDLHMSMVSFSKTTMDNHSATTAQGSFFVFDMNGLIFHRDSLCLLNHPVLGELHQLTAFSWAASELALSILLVHLHDGFDMYELRSTSPVLARTISGRRTVDQSTISALTATGNVNDNKHLRKQLLDYIGGLPWQGTRTSMQVQ
ncbi:hypothetical protein MPSEU_000466700 [Mayamaea pseudoterrestris]|nr:hypothetical protein MPSEU_000466000 [Mayamaea pseudoterrestris]GKY95021.1 hypothetical protein MPSEU_000466700 [Mayamaea pseudoterrestris]